MTEPEAAISADELARLLSVSKVTVYRMAQAGEIPAFRVGRRWRFFPSAVISNWTNRHRPGRSLGDQGIVDGSREADNQRRWKPYRYSCAPRTGQRSST